MIIMRFNSNHARSMIPLGHICRFSVGLAGLFAGAALFIQATHQSIHALEAPSVELTSQEILPPASQNKRLIWLEIKAGGYEVESINHHPLPLSEPDCHKDMAFSPRLSGDRFQKDRPLVFSWAIRADISWLCLEMIASTGSGQPTSKLYAALQIIKPEVKITDRPTVEITSRYNTSSPGRKLVWIKIASNGYDLKEINHHPLPLPESDCRKELSFRTLIGTDRFGGKPELDFPLAVSSKGSHLCVEVVYADDTGRAAPNLYLPLPIEEVVERRIAEFILQSGPAAQAPAQTPAVRPDPTPATAPVENTAPGGNDDPQPPAPEAGTIEVAEENGSEQEAEGEETPRDRLKDAVAGTEPGSDNSIYFKIFVFVVAGIVVLTLSIFLIGKRR